MGNDLTTIAQSIAPSKYADDETMSSMSTSTWLPRLQLCGSNTLLCKEKKVEMGTYALIRSANDFVPMGERVEAILFNRRPKAMRISGDEVTSIFNPESEEFKAIQQESEEQDSGCFWGPEFLLYLPTLKEFCLFLCGSKSARREAKVFYALMHKPIILEAYLAKSKRYSWHVPKCLPNTAFDQSLVPDQAQVNKVNASFIAPPEEEVEAADQTPSMTRER